MSPWRSQWLASIICHDNKVSPSSLKQQGRVLWCLLPTANWHNPQSPGKRVSVRGCQDQLGLKTHPWEIVLITNRYGKVQPTLGGTIPQAWVSSYVKEMSWVFSLLLPTYVMRPVTSSSCCHGLPVVMNWNLELKVQINPISLKLLFVRTLYRGDRNKTKTRILSPHPHPHFPFSFIIKVYFYAKL
jgi:hypothetical protein